MDKVKYVWQAVDRSGHLTSMLAGPFDTREEAFKYAAVTSADETEPGSSVYRRCSMNRRGDGLFALQVVTRF